MLPEKDFTKLERVIGANFNDKQLLQQAFVHRSALNEYKLAGMDNNERLEFLGDAVLELVTTEFLYYNYNKPEGELTNWRSALVRGQHLATRAEELGFGDYLYLSHGEAKSGGKAKQLILANTFEAVIGAIFLDQGYEVAKVFITKNILSHLDDILKLGMHLDPKSRLQEVTQEKFGITPGYQVLAEEGPDHAKKFTVGVYLGDEKIGDGVGSSKQNAQIDAAMKGIKHLEKKSKITPWLFLWSITIRPGWWGFCLIPLPRQ